MADQGRPDEIAPIVADTLLRNIGGRVAILRLPSPGVAGEVQEQLGLSLPSFQDMELSPVAFRKARGQVRSDETVLLELLVSATCVRVLAGFLDGSETAAATTLFGNAYGVMIDDVLMEIETVTWSDVAGSPCVYRLILRRPT